MTATLPGKDHTLQQQDTGQTDQPQENGDPYRRLVELSFDGIVVHSGGRILSVNPPAVKLFGAETSDQLVGELMLDFVHPDYQAVVEERIQKAREEGTGAPLIEEKLIRLDGQEVDVEVTATPTTYEGRPAVQVAFRNISARKHMEHALRENERQYRSSVENLQRLAHEVEERRLYLESVLAYAPDAIITLDAQHRIQEWNPGAETLFGYTPAEAVGRDIDELITGSDTDTFEEAEGFTYQVLVGESVPPTETIRYRKDGSPVNVIVAGSPIVMQDKVVGIVGVYTDISQYKQAEEALRRYAERLRTLRSIDGTILAAWSPEEIAQAALRHIRKLVPCVGAGVVLFDFDAHVATVFAIHSDAKSKIETGSRIPMGTLAHIQTLGQGKTVTVHDVTQLSKSPPLIQALQVAGVHSYVAAPLIAHGELNGTLALGAASPYAFSPEHMDIIREVANQIAVALHQARLREALEAEQQRLGVLIEHLPEGVLLLDGEHRILLANPAAQINLPILTTAAGKPTVRIGDVLSYLADRPMDELLRPPPEGLWHTLETPGPPRRIFEVVAQPITTKTHIGGWVVLIRDVTEERETQERAQLQERLAAVGQLAGGIAHDFNNLLTTIMLYAQLPLGKADLAPDVVRALETILSESRQAAALIQQILDFSRRSPVETKPVDLRPFINKAVRVLQRTIPENISLLQETETGEHTVNADPTRIQQVLMNLVVNARDAMPDGGVLRIKLSKVTVGPGEEPPVARMHPGQWICLAVSDTGIGIPPDILPHIFDPFFTTKPRGKGAGLGLAQVYGIVEQHAGSIGVETQIDQGTTFSIYLPGHQVEKVEIPQKETALTPPPGRGETILLVEDNERLRQAAQEFLDSLGYRILTAADGQEALAAYQSTGAIDLVITDVVMPEMGGKELIRQIRRANPHLKALAITGHVPAQDLQELRAEGILDVLYKPIDVDALAHTIRTILDQD